MTTARIVGVLNTPTDAEDLTVFLNRLTAEHGPGLTVGPGAWTAYEVRTPGVVCWCVTCRDSDAEAVASLLGDPLVCLARRMVVCPDCGSKRCPRAAHHDQACAGEGAGRELVAAGVPDLLGALQASIDAARQDRAR